jgi:hypothetical protein
MRVDPVKRGDPAFGGTSIIDKKLSMFLKYEPIWQRLTTKNDRIQSIKIP